MADQFDENGFYIGDADENKIYDDNATHMLEAEYGAPQVAADKGVDMFELRRQAQQNMPDLAQGSKADDITCTWKKVDAAPIPGLEMPDPRSGHCAFTLNANDCRLFIHGGAADSAYFQDVYCFHTILRKWMLAHTYSKPLAVAYHSTLLVQPDMDLEKTEPGYGCPRLVTYGGFNKGRVQGELRMIDHWSVVAKGKTKNMMIAPPRRRKDIPPKDNMNDVWRDVEEMCGEVPLARCMHTATLVNGRHLVLIGGWHSEFVNDVYVLDVHTMVWEYKTCSMRGGGELPEGRAGHTATLIAGHRILVFGGQNKKGQLDEVLLLDLNIMEWSYPKCKVKRPSRRSGHSACHDGEGRVIFYGGWDGIRQRDDLHILNTKGDPDKDWRWENVSVSGYKLGGRCGHTTTMVGDQMWLFGGWSNGYFYNDLYILDTSRAVSKFRSAGAAVVNMGKNKIGMVAAAALGQEREEKKKEEELKAERKKALESEELNADQLVEINKQLDKDMGKLMHEFQGRKLRLIGENSKDREAVRLRAEEVAETRRQVMHEALNQGMTMQEAIILADERCSHLRPPTSATRASVPDQLDQQSRSQITSASHSVRSGSQRSSQIGKWEVSAQGRVRAIVPPPKEKDLTVREREDILNGVAPYHKMVLGDKEYDFMAEDALGTIASTGGLATCYDDQRRRDYLAQQTKQHNLDIGKEGALVAALEHAYHKTVTETHPDTFSSLRKPGTETVPKGATRPGRHMQFQPEVGLLENIRDGVVPQQPVMMALPAPGPAPSGSLRERDRLRESAEMQRLKAEDAAAANHGALVEYSQQGGASSSNALVVHHPSAIGTMSAYNDLALRDHLAREHDIPKGIQGTIGLMQSHLRGHLTRKQIKQHRAALMIQRNVRGWIIRNHMSKGMEVPDTGYAKIAYEKRMAERRRRIALKTLGQTQM